MTKTIRMAKAHLIESPSRFLSVLDFDHAQLEACLERAAQIERTEAAILAGIQGGASLIEMTNLADHVAALRSGKHSRLSITPPS